MCLSHSILKRSKNSKNQVIKYKGRLRWVSKVKMTEW